MLANGAGGIDWSGLPVAVAVLGVEDVADLIDGLMTCKLYRKPDIVKD